MTRRNHSAFGSSRERAVAQILRDDGWVVFRCAASKPCDLVALRDAPYLEKARAAGVKVGRDPEARLIEVKGTTRSPWVAWGPTERAELVDAAKRAGATPLLAWWPPHGELTWYGEAEWPA